MLKAWAGIGNRLRSGSDVGARTKLGSSWVVAVNLAGTSLGGRQEISDSADSGPHGEEAERKIAFEPRVR